MVLYGLIKDQVILTAEAHRKSGKAARDTIPFTAQAHFNPVHRDPVAFIEEQNKDRLPNLIALRKEKMSVKPFTFYRGSALLMTNDLVQQTITGSQLIICSDAHLSNSGLFASPERRLVKVPMPIRSVAVWENPTILIKILLIGVMPIQNRFIEIMNNSSNSLASSLN